MPQMLMKSRQKRSIWNRKKYNSIIPVKGYMQMLSYLTGEQLDENMKPEKPLMIESVDYLTNELAGISMSWSTAGLYKTVIIKIWIKLKWIKSIISRRLFCLTTNYSWHKSITTSKNKKQLLLKMPKSLNWKEISKKTHQLMNDLLSVFDEWLAVCHEQREWGDWESGLAQCSIADEYLKLQNNKW